MREYHGTKWHEREDVETLPAFVVATLARYEDGVRTELAAELEDAGGAPEVNAANEYAEAARSEMVSLLDFLVGRLEAAND